MITEEAGRNARSLDWEGLPLYSSDVLGQAVAMEEPRRRLGALVMAARKRAGYRQRKDWAEAIGLTAKTLAKVETGKYVSDATLIEIENHLDWPTGEAQRILAGEDPIPVDHEPRIEPTRSAAEVVATTDPDQLQELVTAALKLVPRIRKREGDAIADAWIKHLLDITREAGADLRDEIRHTR